MAGFGMILGGAVKGYGEGVLAEAQAKRKAALDAIEAERQDRRIAEDREFRSREAEIGRTAQSEENEKQRQFSAGENEKNRSTQGTYSTTDDGSSVFVQGDKAKPVTGEDGKPVKMATSKDAKPAEIATAEWLVQQGVAGDVKEAWAMVRSSRTDPEKSRAGIYKEWLRTLKPEFGNVKDPAKLQEEATRMTEQTMRMLEQADAPAGDKPAPGKRPAGVSDDAVIKQAQDAIAAGADKAAVRTRLMEMGIDPAAAGL
jgi:hypothetical protein